MTHLNILLKQIVDMQKQMKNKNQIPSEINTLICLKLSVTIITRKIHLIWSCQQNIVSFLGNKNLNTNEGELCAGILNIIYELIQYGDICNSPSIFSEQKILWEIFIITLYPLCSEISNWLFWGDSLEFQKEFFITTNQRSDFESIDYWMDAYPINPKACPKFLAMVIEKIHDGGKALQFLKNRESIRNYNGSIYTKEDGFFCLIKDQWHKGHLVDLLKNCIKKSLKDDMKNITNNFNSNTKTSIYQYMEIAGFHSQNNNILTNKSILYGYRYGYDDVDRIFNHRITNDSEIINMIKCTNVINSFNKRSKLTYNYIEYDKEKNLYLKSLKKYNHKAILTNYEIEHTFEHEFSDKCHPECQR